MQTDSSSQHTKEASSTVHENGFCYTGVTRWFMKCQTLLPLKNSGLHICLSCLFQLSWWHTVPISPGMVLWTCGKWMVEGRFPPFWGGKQAMNEKSGENGKVSHCALSLWRALNHTSRQSCAYSSKESGSFPSEIEFQFWPSQNGNAVTTFSFLKITLFFKWKYSNKFT